MVGVLAQPAPMARRCSPRLSPFTLTRLAASASRRCRAQGAIRPRSGVHVLAVLHSLAMALDETAKDAAKAIRFSPALNRAGEPIDFVATVTVAFRLILKNNEVKRMCSLNLWTIVLPAHGSGRFRGCPTANNGSAGLSFPRKRNCLLQPRRRSAHVLIGDRPSARRGHLPGKCRDDNARYTLKRDRYILSRVDGAASTSSRSLSIAACSGATAPPNAPTPSSSSTPLTTSSPQTGPQLRHDQLRIRLRQECMIGGLHCQIYDVHPRGSEGFTGRVYIETAAWNIVRFTGFISRVGPRALRHAGKQSKFARCMAQQTCPRSLVTANVYIEEVLRSAFTLIPLSKPSPLWGYGRPRIQ